jgi:hypothetical protein
MQKSKKRNLEIGSNAGETTTATLVFMALHDMHGFSKARMERIKKKCNEYNHQSLAKDPDFTGSEFIAMRTKMERLGVDERLERDFISWIVSGLGMKGKEQRRAAMASIEASYIYLFLALHELFGFGSRRLRNIQEKIKFYAGCIRDGEPGIEEYMKCMEVECGQVYPGLKACEAAHGEVKIYG